MYSTQLPPTPTRAPNGRIGLGELLNPPPPPFQPSLRDEVTLPPLSSPDRYSAHQTSLPAFSTFDSRLERPQDAYARRSPVPARPESGPRSHPAFSTAERDYGYDSPAARWPTQRAPEGEHGSYGASAARDEYRPRLSGGTPATLFSAS